MRTLQEIHRKGGHKVPRTTCPLCREQHGERLEQIQQEHAEKMQRLIDNMKGMRK